MVQAIISSKTLFSFLKSVIEEMDDINPLTIENGKISFIFFEIPIEHKGSGDFIYSEKMLNNFKCMISGLQEQPLNIEFHEKQIKLIIE